MGLVIVACTARHIDLADGVYVGFAPTLRWDFGVSFVVNNQVLLRPFAARMRAVSHEDAITQSGIYFLPFFNFFLCVGKVPNFAAIW